MCTISNEVSGKLEKVMEARCALSKCTRELIATVEGESLFGIAFIMAYGPEASHIGDALGLCYYLSALNIEGLSRNETIDLFAEKMKTVVSELTARGMWNPMLRDIVAYIIKRFEKRLKN